MKKLDPTLNAKIYQYAVDYLLAYEEITEEILEKHLRAWKGREVKNLNDLFKRMVFHSQNRQGMPNSIGNINKLSPLLYDWDCKKVAESYRSWGELFNTIKQSTYTPPGRMMKDNPHNYWVQFTKSIISIASFVSRFEDIEKFNTFVEVFYYNEDTRIALPLLLKEEIFGYQFALSCDFLKENGYPEFVKPDVHIIDIFVGLGISDTRNDFQVFRDVISFSKSIQKLPYEVDKLFWLIGSGKFYLDEINVKTSKKEFIQLAKDKGYVYKS